MKAQTQSGSRSFALTLLAAVFICWPGCPAQAVPTNGLALWLDASDLNGNGSNPVYGAAISTWADKSGAGHSATQNTASCMPSYVTGAIGTNPVVRFGGDDWLSAGTLCSATGNVSAFVVSQRSTSQAGGDTYQRLVSTSDGGDVYDWQPPDWTVTSSYRGTDGVSLVYGPVISTLSAGSGNLKIAGLCVGKDAARGGSRLKGDIGEILVYNRQLTGSDLSAVTHYLSVKWLQGTNAGPASVPLVGAIRWDAWIGNAYSVGQAVNKSLGPEHWHYRLPYFGSEVSATQVVVQSTLQADADRQIALAKAGGIDYWAYCMYATNDPMTCFGIDLHLSSTHRDDVKFCLINQGTSPAGWTDFQTRMIGYFQMSNHVTVAGNRPLFYLFNPSTMKNNFGSWDAARAAFDQLRAATTNAGLGNPYMVAMDSTAATADTYRQNLGFDAISAYALQHGDAAATYAQLATYVQNWWNTARDTGAHVIPTVMTGWDRRPRVENPVPWESWQVQGSGLQYYYAAPTPPELASHLQAALDWVQATPANADAHAVLMYAWNEIDEGGWLLPTLAEKTARLEAVRSVKGALADSDGDGIDDLWELWYFPSLTHASANSDSDGDGFLDRSEYLAGTDPTNKLSLLAFSAIRTGATSNEVTLRWQSVTGKSYALLETTNLASGGWFTNGGGMAATPPMNTATVQPTKAALYYRVQAN